jgi:hypothetical protein
MLENGIFWEASAVLALVSKHMGRLRLVGMVDLFADEIMSGRKSFVEDMRGREMVTQRFFL